MHVTSITLKSGRIQSAGSQEVKLKPMTVFVGPNNSGKSVALREVAQACNSAGVTSNTYIIKDISFVGLNDPNEVETEIEKHTATPGHMENVMPGYFIFHSARHPRSHFHRDQFAEALSNPKMHSGFFGCWLTSYMLNLDGPNRINLIQDQGVQDLQELPRSSFVRLFQDNEKRAHVRKIIYDAFGRYLVIDPTSLGKLRLRLSDRLPENEQEERGIHDAAIAFHKEADLITLASDGMKAFTGMIVEAVAGEPKVVLIDEPEAFLHPASAFKLGNEFSKLATAAGRNIFVSTHSQNFIMGCLHAGVDINIIRLTYMNKVATSRVLPSNKLVTMMRNPLLRSAGVISALFYEYVVVTEADRDRAFYQEINERLAREGQGIPNCLFINAQNKQTIRTIIGPLRELGIPAAAFVDIDIIKDGGTDWTQWMAAAAIPDALHQSYSVMRHSVMQIFQKYPDKDMKRDGIDFLEATDRAATDHLFDRLAEYGIFVVRVGEVECWLKSLEVQARKSDWLIEMFGRMGSDPDGSEYIQPSTDDVWAFIGTAKHWLIDQNRKGIPE